ncbi:signal peptidase II [Oceanivirga miroungae]|uniref:Lipoprotein signal peptidase n=1 Tax=Oceanivirga miroungae TaxID=1130046 RepID=A0A6I8MA90_9FUSO|nr:signal peptidase II [Oceanivirga miroungae]VWL85228.1 signal peptidase II [Oceanivirga miroungae]
MTSIKKNSISIYIIFITLLVCIDQLTKQAIYNLSNGRLLYSKSIIGDFFRITYIENHGGIFGLAQGHIIWFTIISTAMIIYIYLTELKNFRSYSMINKIAVSFIISGAIGNMLDRYIRGYVIDMLDFRAIWSFIFNVADVYINIGIYILIIAYILKYLKEKKG